MELWIKHSTYAQRQMYSEYKFVCGGWPYVIETDVCRGLVHGKIGDMVTMLLPTFCIRFWQSNCFVIIKQMWWLSVWKISGWLKQLQSQYGNWLWFHESAHMLLFINMADNCVDFFFFNTTENCAMSKISQNIKQSPMKIEINMGISG